MPSKLKLPKALEDAAQTGNQGIFNFFPVKKKTGRPKKARTAMAV
jgi:hypothetical protein